MNAHSIAYVRDWLDKATDEERLATIRNRDAIPHIHAVLGLAVIEYVKGIPNPAAKPFDAVAAAPTLASPFESQVGGDHYRTMKMQPAEFCHRNGIGKLEGDIIAYVCRWRGKGGIEDLKKARHTIDLILAME